MASLRAPSGLLCLSEFRKIARQYGVADPSRAIAATVSEAEDLQRLRQHLCPWARC